MQHALDAGDDDEFVPPEYEGDEIELEPGFYKHEADYLHVLQGIPVSVFAFILSASLVFTSVLACTLEGRLRACACACILLLLHATSFSARLRPGFVCVCFRAWTYLHVYACMHVAAGGRLGVR